jgi:hypothetical protein
MEEAARPYMRCDDGDTASWTGSRAVVKEAGEEGERSIVERCRLIRALAFNVEPGEYFDGVIGSVSSLDSSWPLRVRDIRSGDGRCSAVLGLFDRDPALVVLALLILSRSANMEA